MMTSCTKNESLVVPAVRALCTLRPHSDDRRSLYALGIAGICLSDCAQNTRFVESPSAPEAHGSTLAKIFLNSAENEANRI